MRHYGVFYAPRLDWGLSVAMVFDMALPDDKLDPKTIPAFAAVRAFEAVGRLGGIRAAAAGLNIDHSVVSRHLRHLEDFVGVALVVREGGGLHLTEAGARYHSRIAAALAELALATTEVRDPGISNVILVWCVPGFAAQWVTDRLARFEQLWPDFHLELRPTDIRANLGAHEADVDIRFYQSKTIRNVQLSLCAMHLDCSSSPKQRRAKRNPHRCLLIFLVAASIARVVLEAASMMAPYRAERARPHFPV